MDTRGYLLNLFETQVMDTHVGMGHTRGKFSPARGDR